MVSKRAIAKAPIFKPITIGGFSLTATGMEVKPGSRPSMAEYEAVGEFIHRAHSASGFWLGDWLRYGETREDWRERLSQAQDLTGLTEKTARNVRAIARGIDPSRRRDDVEFSLHGAVSGMSAEDQNEWLEKAALGGWSLRDLRHAIEKGRRSVVLEGRAAQTFDVEVTIRVSVEALSPYLAESKAWEIVKAAIAADVDKGLILKSAAKVIAAHVLGE